MQKNLRLFCSPIIKKEFIQPLLFFSIILIPIICYNIIIIHPSKHPSLFSIDFLSQFLPSTTSPPLNLDSQTCDYSYGKWVWDESQIKRKYSENCRFLDQGFQCQRNGRYDLNYQKWRWQPKGCDIPRFDPNDFLERSRNGRIVFAGDSIGRNQWESLVCMLTEGVSNQSKVYEEFGHPITKHKGFLSIKFEEFNLTVEYYRQPYLVTVDRPPQNASKKVYGTIRIDKLHWFSTKWVGADVLIFSAGHWWNQYKTVKSGHYFQEGGYVNMTMDVMEAFRRSLITLRSWMMQNLDQGKSHVFFRSYSPVHFSGGEWNQGGYCNTSREPETNYTKIESEPISNKIISKLVQQMNIAMRKVKFLNITFMTAVRKDGHPSKHRELGVPANAPQDCSHWCLPGVPDTWNDLLYTELLTMGFRTSEL